MFRVTAAHYLRSGLFHALQEVREPLVLLPASQSPWAVVPLAAQQLPFWPGHLAVPSNVGRAACHSGCDLTPLQFFLNLLLFLYSASLSCCSCFCLVWHPWLCVVASGQGRSSTSQQYLPQERKLNRSPPPNGTWDSP